MIYSQHTSKINDKVFYSIINYIKVSTILMFNVLWKLVRETALIFMKRNWLATKAKQRRWLLNSESKMSNQVLLHGNVQHRPYRTYITLINWQHTPPPMVVNARRACAQGLATVVSPSVCVCVSVCLLPL